MDKSSSQLVEELCSIKGNVNKGFDMLTSFLSSYEENVNAMEKRMQEREAEIEAKAKEEREKLEEERSRLYAEIAAEKEKLATEKELMRDIQSFQKTKIKLDVGGQSFTTSLTTLRKDPDSLLAKMFSGRYSLEQDEADGSYFIDRDGRHFHHILNYLRMPEEYEPPKDTQTCEELVKEARYYQLEGLRVLLGDDIITVNRTELPVNKEKALNGIEKDEVCSSMVKSLEELAKNRLNEPQQQQPHKPKQEETKQDKEEEKDVGGDVNEEQEKEGEDKIEVKEEEREERPAVVEGTETAM